MHISLTQAVEVAELVVDQHGWNHIDTSSVYFKAPNEPGCLIGAILHRLGFSYDSLNVSAGCGYGTFSRCALNGAALAELVAHNVITVDPITMQFLRILQRCNDQKVPWGAALAHAKNEINWPEPIKQKMISIPSIVVNKITGYYFGVGEAKTTEETKTLVSV